MLLKPEVALGGTSGVEWAMNYFRPMSETYFPGISFPWQKRPVAMAEKLMFNFRSVFIFQSSGWECKRLLHTALCRSVSSLAMQEQVKQQGYYQPQQGILESCLTVLQATGELLRFLGGKELKWRFGVFYFICESPFFLASHPRLSRFWTFSSLLIYWVFTRFIAIIHSFLINIMQFTQYLLAFGFLSAAQALDSLDSSPNEDHVLKRSPLLADRATCSIAGWIPACPSMFLPLHRYFLSNWFLAGIACVPVGAICCSDGLHYVMPPNKCRSGTTPVVRDPLYCRIEQN